MLEKQKGLRFLSKAFLFFVEAEVPEAPILDKIPYT